MVKISQPNLGFMTIPNYILHDLHEICILIIKSLEFMILSADDAKLKSVLWPINRVLQGHYPLK
jgi:hypothetical protein